jgi:peptide deformylase
MKVVWVLPDVRESYTETNNYIWIQDRFCNKTEVFDGLIARVIQHEYDHIEGNIIHR